MDITVDPDYPNSWRRPEFYERIKKWATMASQRITGPIYFVLVQIGSRKIIVLPDKEIDLGYLSDNERFEVKRDVKGALVEFSARIVSGSESRPARVIG